MTPLNGKHRGIALRAQTVEATIFEDATGVWADTDVRFRLQNPDTKPITVTVSLPGPRAFPADLPDGIEMLMGDAPVQLQPGTAANDSNESILWAPISLPAGQSVNVRITYRQALPDQDGMVVFAYMSAAAKDWARAPEGVKVNIRFKTPVESESILSIAPPPKESETGSMTWQWEGEKNLTNVGMAMMAPSWWRAYTAEREKAALPDATAADFVALAERYKHLAQLPLLPFQNSDFFDQFYPSAVSSLEAAVAKSDIAESPEAASVFDTLIVLYDERAQKSDVNQRYLYTQLAADAAIRGLAAGHTGPEMRAQAAQMLDKALTLAQNRDDVGAARDYEAQLDSLRLGANGLSAGDRERTRLRNEASLALERKDYRQARTLLAGLDLSDSPVPVAFGAPLVSSLLVEVSTASNARQIRVISGDGEEAGSGQALLQAIYEALHAGNEKTVAFSAEGLNITIPFTNGDELRSAQESLAARLPDLPETALLLDVLRPPELVLAAGIEPLQVTEMYAEQISLRSSKDQWEGIASQLEDAASSMSASDSAASAEVKGTKALVASVLRHDAEAWRHLNASSGVVYRVRLSDEFQTEREWSAEPGAARLLLASAERWRDDQVKRAFAGAGAGAIILAGIVTGFTLLLGRLARRLRR